MPTVQPDDFPAVTSFDVSDENPSAVSNHLRALQREVRDGFDSIGRALTALGRIEERLIVVIDRQNILDRRLDDHERRLAALEAPHVISLPALPTANEIVQQMARNTKPKRAAKGPRKKR